MYLLRSVLEHQPCRLPPALLSRPLSRSHMGSLRLSPLASCRLPLTPHVYPGSRYCNTHPNETAPPSQL